MFCWFLLLVHLLLPVCASASSPSPEPDVDLHKGPMHAGHCKPSERIIELAIIGGHTGNSYVSLVHSEGVQVSSHVPVHHEQLKCPVDCISMS